MKILFDNGTPNPIAHSLAGHEVVFARQVGWQELKNGDLLRHAEQAGFDLILTSDKNMRYQQNLSRHRIAIVILGNQQWPDVRLQLGLIVGAITAALPGSVTEVPIPHME